MAFYPLAATLISAAFAATLWARYRARPRPYLLAWAVALALYAIAALTEVMGVVLGWNPLLFRTYYFFGGIVLVGVLALGTVLLLFPRLGRATLALLIVLAGAGLIGVAGANLQTGLLEAANRLHQVPSLNTIGPERSLFNVLAIAMAVIINIVGTLTLIGGALWSAYALWRRGLPSNRLWANVLIAAGAFVVAGASSLTRLGFYELFYVGQAVGVLVMFGGFLTAERAPGRARQPVPAA
ncbi:MAG TPA: hypothetical protein VET65_10635 [Candidatus Limnocylindrales bacterium]|nr:hypothetical protein [Candidatus Limnocylindrales bacterium]